LCGSINGKYNARKKDNESLHEIMKAHIPTATYIYIHIPCDTCDKEINNKGIQPEGRDDRIVDYVFSVRRKKAGLYW
jgi:hypothetical protein